jgi:aspartate dehydrogenase
LDRVQITTTKHPRGLQGSPYLVKNGISLDNLQESKIIFEGTAREAIEGFPANVNVSITLSFAGIGIDKTRVQIVADPDVTKTRHEITAEGAFGSIHSITEGVTAPGNPRTGYLAILSAMAMLNRIRNKARIGT